MTATNNSIQPGFWIGLLLIATLLFAQMKCKAQSKAQYDTIPCNSECIQKYAVEKNSKGKERVYMVYADEKNNILDLIPVSNSVYEYIQLCVKNGITPSLGIKLRNGQIYSIIKSKPYVKKRNVKREVSQKND